MNHTIIYIVKRTRYVDSTPMSGVIPVTIRYIHPAPHHSHTKVNVMVMYGWLPSPSFHVNQPSYSWDKAISNFDLETSRSMSWVWSKGKVIHSAQYLVVSLSFHFTSIRLTIPEIPLFRNLILKYPRSKSWVRSKVEVIQFTQYPTDALPFFISRQSNQSFQRYG